MLVKTSTRSLLLVMLSLFSFVVHAQSSDTSGVTKGDYSGAMETVYPDWFKTSFLELAEDVSEATEAGKRLMLIFHQDGCPYCNAFVERNLAQKDITETLQSKFDVIEINMWGERDVWSIDGQQYTEKAFSAALKVQFTPTVMFLNEEGDVALRINGYYNPDRFRLALEYAAGGLDTSESFADFMEKHQGKSSNHNAAKNELPTQGYFTGPITELHNRPGKGSRPLLILFEQKDCSNCKILQDKVLARKESQDLLAEFDVYQVNMWGDKSFKTPTGEVTTERQWTKKLGISYAPTLLLYASTGEEVIRSEAWFKAFHTQSILDYVVSDTWLEQPSFQRYISARADEMRERGIDVDIWD